MKKSFIAIVSLILIAACAFCVGCGEKKEPETPPSVHVPEPGSLDVTALANTICASCKFDDSGLAASPDSEFVMCTVYGTDPALIAGETGSKKVAVYNSSASPEMIICVEAVDADAARSIMEGTITSLLDDYITNYTNYGPEEVTKLTTAVKEQRGTYVILAVTADNTAAQGVVYNLLG